MVSNASGAVVIGDPDAGGCIGNTTNGGVSLSGNTAGVRLQATRVAGTAQVFNTRGATIVGGNNVGGWLQCSGNNPVATNGGHPNTAAGRTGECAAPAF